MKEKQRFYRATSKPKDGKVIRLTFRADNMTEAQHHTMQCFSEHSGGINPYGKLEIASITFVGITEPQNMGWFEEI